MYRVRSTDVWYNAPGVVAAYQPIAAPGPLLARYNVGNDARMAGQYTAQPGVLPAWSGTTGWGSKIAANWYLSTGLTAATNTTWTYLCCFSAAESTSGNAFGLYGGAGDKRLQLDVWSSGSSALDFGNGNLLKAGATSNGTHVGGFAGNAAYQNGKILGTILSGALHVDTLFVGAVNSSGSPDFYLSIGYIQAFAIASITLSPAHVAQYSRQMAYCHVNPDWSAWGRRRRYYYAPSAAGFQAAWSGQANRLIGGGADRV